jgi:hypothetical protein
MKLEACQVKGCKHIEQTKYSYFQCKKFFQKWLSITQSSRDCENTSRDRGVREIENPEIKGPTILFFIMDNNSIVNWTQDLYMYKV